MLTSGLVLTCLALSCAAQPLAVSLSAAAELSKRDGYLVPDVTLDGRSYTMKIVPDDEAKDMDLAEHFARSIPQDLPRHNIDLVDNTVVVHIPGAEDGAQADHTQAKIDAEKIVTFYEEIAHTLLDERARRTRYPYKYEAPMIIKSSTTPLDYKGTVLEQLSRRRSSPHGPPPAPGEPFGIIANGEHGTRGGITGRG